MPSLMAILGLDATGFNRGLNRAVGTAQAAGTRVASALSSRIVAGLAGVASVGAISAIGRETIEWAGQLSDVADALQVNVEWLQKMANGAQLAGANVEDLAKFIGEMNRSRQEALLDPEGRDAQAMSRLGINRQQIRELSTQAFFDQIVAAFQNGASTQTINDVQEVGGRAAKNLLAAFQSQFANDMPVLAESLVYELDAIGDRFTSLKQTLMVQFAPAVLFAQEKLIGFIQYIRQVGTFLGSLSTALSPSQIKADISNANNGLTEMRQRHREEYSAKEKEIRDSQGIWGERLDMSRVSELTELRKRQEKEFWEKERQQSPGAKLTARIEQAWAEASKQVVNDQRTYEQFVEEQAKALARADKLRRDAVNAPPQFDETTAKLGKSAPNFRSDLNANQKIGAYASMNPAQERMLNLVGDIKKSVTKIADKSERQPFKNPNSGVTF